LFISGFFSRSDGFGFAAEPFKRERLLKTVTVVFDSYPGAISSPRLDYAYMMQCTQFLQGCLFSVL
jgi:hypothetical protein